MNSKVYDADLSQDLRDIDIVSRCMAFASGALAEGTNTHTIKTTVAIPYIIDGVFGLKAITDNIAMNALTVQPVGNRCRYLITLDASGNVTLTKGTQVVNLSTGAITTLAWDSMRKRITDSNSGLAAFQVNDKILISGFTNLVNNGIFTVDEVGPLGAWLKVRENEAVDEAAGNSVTILRESLLPDLPAKACPIGILIVTTGTVAFTSGTTDLTYDLVTSGSGTFSFVNIGAMPPKG